MTTIQFIETQKFTQWWIWLILLIAALVPAGVLVNVLTNSNPESNDAWLAVIPSLLIVGAVIFLILSAKLTVELDDFAINYRFYPLHFSNQKIHWEDVKHAYVRKYNPILEYGGWGLRYSLGSGKAYNVMGNMGLQVELKNGKKILFGTQRKEDLEEVMQLLYASKKVNN